MKMKKDLRTDYHGDEDLIKPFMIVITFIGLSALLITISSPSQYWSSVNQEIVEGWETVGLQYEFWDNNYTVTDSDTQIHDGVNPWDIYHVVVEYDDPDNFYYFDLPDYYPSGPAIRVAIFRNNPAYDLGDTNWWETSENCFIVSRSTQDWPFINIRKAVVPFSELEVSTLSNNRSYASFNLGEVNATIFITAMDEDFSVAESLYMNENYNIKIGTAVGQNIGSTSMWTALGQLLTLKLPNCHPVVNALLAIPLWAGIGFMAVMIVSRFIPFIGGG